MQQTTKFLLLLIIALNGICFLVLLQYITKGEYSFIFGNRTENALWEEADSEIAESTTWKSQPIWDYDLETVTDNVRNVTILMWTKLYGQGDASHYIREEVPVPDWCIITNDRSRLAESQGVVFHARDFSVHDIPSTRRVDQPWVMFSIESPPHESMHSLDKLQFNRTMTYRLDSDYPSPYGFTTPRKKILDGNPYFTDPNFPKTQKTDLVAWMVSNCGTQSQREVLVDELRKYIKIGVYGSCGTLKCKVQDRLGCYQEIGRQYKFYLSFENSLCTDYITEKFSNALRSYLVPIVYGGGNYSSVIPYPKKSYIDARQFVSMKALAEYLHYLDKNETAYAEYFEWHRYYELHVRQVLSGFRKMCYALQRGDHTRYKVYNNLNYWWGNEGICTIPKKLNL